MQPRAFFPICLNSHSETLQVRVNTLFCHPNTKTLRHRECLIARNPRPEPTTYRRFVMGIVQVILMMEGYAVIGLWNKETSAR